MLNGGQWLVVCLPFLQAGLASSNSSTKPVNHRSSLMRCESHRAICTSLWLCPLDQARWRAPPWPDIYWPTWPQWPMAKQGDEGEKGRSCSPPPAGFLIDSNC